MGADLREVLLTLSQAQYEDFVRDLEALREAGAASNTQGILEAVHARAEKLRAPVEMPRAA